MKSFVRFFRKLGLIIQRKRFDDELEEEMTFHREQAEKAFQAEGMTAEAARFRAMRQFGNLTRLKERSHEVIGFRAESMVQDSRFAIRQLGKDPGFALTAVLTLALGMGASIAIFAFVDAALIKPLPYPNPKRLVSVEERGGLWAHSPLSYPDYLDWKRQNRALSSMDVYSGVGALLSTPKGAEPVPAVQVSAGFFRTLGITPVLGRDFHPDEDASGVPNAVLLRFGTWQRRFGGRKDIVGQTVKLDGIPSTIIGVLPEDFQFAPRDAEFWSALHGDTRCWKQRACHNLEGIGRLRDGVSVQTALAEMKSIARRLEMQYPDSNRGQSAAVVPLSEAIVGDVRPILLVMLSGAGLLLLIACVNVSSLLLVRSESRRREIAVRSALGASRARISGQFVTEGVVLVAGSSLASLVLADAGMQSLRRLISKDMMASMPYLQGLGLNPHVLLFAGIFALFAAVLLSVTPILRLPLSEMHEGLTEGGRSSSSIVWRRLGCNLVTIELATAVVLLSCAGLLGKSFYRLLHVELGFPTDHLATLDVALPQTGFDKDGQIVEFGRQVVQRLETLPGVKSAAITSVLPVSCNCNTDWIRIVGRPYNGIHNEVNQRDVTANFFTTLRASILRGRFFTDAEDASKPKVAIINEAFARKYFPGEDPVGKKIGGIQLSPDSIKEIVGVVGYIKDSALDEDLWPAVYYPFNQNTDTYFSVVVHTMRDDASMLPTVAAAIHKLNPDVGVRDEMTMNQRINVSQTAYLHRSSAWLVGSFATLALLLSAIGLYGVIAYSVSQRTREIGVRMALGAKRSAVYRLVLREAGRLTGTGVAAGLVCSVAAATLMRKLLFETKVWDPMTLTTVTVVLVLSALLASFLPARRAASVNPVDALRAE